MRQNDIRNLNDRRIEAALADALDELEPRRDLWPSIEAGAVRSEPLPFRRWFMPVVGVAAASILVGWLVLRSTLLPWTPAGVDPVGRDVAEVSRIEVEATRDITTVVPIQMAKTTVVESSAQVERVDEQPVEAEKAAEVEKVVVVETLAAPVSPVATAKPMDRAVVAEQPVATVEPNDDEVVVEKPGEVEAPAEMEKEVEVVVVAKEVVVEKLIEVEVVADKVVEAVRQAEVIVEHPDVEVPRAKEGPYDTTFFKNYGVSPFIDTANDHLSTFAMDVDTASYTVARRFIRDGYLPDPDSIRVEEFVNYFDQGYEPPVEGAFAIHVDGAPSPFGGDNVWLMRVGLEGRTSGIEEPKDVSLVFVIDVSGSMARENRLWLVKEALRMLVDELRPVDQVGIVAYGSSARIVLEPTSGRDKSTILDAIYSLEPGGSTNAEQGLRMGYQMAAQMMRPGETTRVVLLSDGVANVGLTEAEAILTEVRGYVDAGIELSTIGVGMGNFNDVLLERLANDGNGNYYYVDHLEQAKRVFVRDLRGMLHVIAKDAKVQVDFNPAVVSSYRLLGYDNRSVADEEFRNEAVDAGEVGLGHNVTALYEVRFHRQVEGRVATVYVRYQDPGNGDIREIGRAVHGSDFSSPLSAASPWLQLDAAVAEYAEILRGSYWAQGSSLREVRILAERVYELMPDEPDVAEFLDLVSGAERIADQDDR